MRVKGWIDVCVCNKDRSTELALLLQSLRTQSYQKFDIFIIDDKSGTDVFSFHFIQCIIQRLKFEGHRVTFLRNDFCIGAAKCRQKLVDYVMKNGKGEFICRLDDDVILEVDYLQKLITVIDAGYDLASGLTPHMAVPEQFRENKFIRPVINRVVLDNDGKFLVNCDDCGYLYEEEEILPCHHFRSCALYKKSIHDEGVEYEDNLAGHSFREEEFLSFRMIKAGFKLGVNTGAVVWHLATPSGGERSHKGEDSFVNQKILNRLVKKWVVKDGDFIHKYNLFKIGLKEDKEKFKSLSKSTNLLYSSEV